MKLTRPDLMAYATVVVCVVGIVVLTALRVPVPDFLTFAGTTALGIGGGVALQGVGATTAGPEILPSPAGSSTSLAGNLPVYPPAALTSEPATGVFRAATHAP